MKHDIAPDTPGEFLQRLKRVLRTRAVADAVPSPLPSGQGPAAFLAEAFRHVEEAGVSPDSQDHARLQMAWLSFLCAIPASTEYFVGQFLQDATTALLQIGDVALSQRVFEKQCEAATPALRVRWHSILQAEPRGSALRELVSRWIYPVLITSKRTPDSYYLGEDDDVLTQLSRLAGLDAHRTNVLVQRLRRYKAFVAVLAESMLQQDAASLKEEDVRLILRQALTILVERSGGTALTVVQAVEKAVIELFNTPAGLDPEERERSLRKGEWQFLMPQLDTLSLTEEQRRMIQEGFDHGSLEARLESLHVPWQADFVRKVARLARSRRQEFECPLGV